MKLIKLISSFDISTGVMYFLLSRHVEQSPNADAGLPSSGNYSLAILHKTHRLTYQHWSTVLQGGVPVTYDTNNLNNRSCGFEEVESLRRKLERI